jgi:outer membrane protein
MRFIPFFLVVSAVPAQEFIEAPRFPEKAYFRRHFSVEMPKVELKAPARLSDFVIDGKLELSLKSYTELVLANNTDIQIQRLSVETQKNAIQRAFAPFDPFVQTSFRSTRTTTPSQSVLEGATISQSLSQPLNFSYQQTLATGTQYTVGFGGSKNSRNATFSTFNPALNANLAFGFTQPLLRNRGGIVNRIPIMVARSRLRAGEYTVQDQLLRLLQTAENAYWAVVEAREALQVQEQALQLADTQLKRYNRELEIGAISELDIYLPQQNYANQDILVTQARYRLTQVEDALRRQIGADLDPSYRRMPIVLTQPVLPPSDDRPIDKEATVEQALRQRPDLKATLQNLDIDDLNFRTAKNSLLPDLSLTGNYQSTGVGGPFAQRQNVFAGDGTQSTIVNVIPGGLGDAVSQVFGFNYPIYGFGLTLRFPIRDRRAAADLADAMVSKRLNTLRVRNTEQAIRQEVLNAITQVESSRQSVKLAQVSLDFSQKRRDAEEKKYNLGVTTIFFVLEADNALTRSKADLVTQSVQYQRNLLNLLRVTGQLLDERGVVVQ